MIGIRFVIFISVLPAIAFSQSEAWIKVDSDAVLYLSPPNSEWIPVSAKQKIPVKTYLLTKPDAKAFLFKETAAYELPAAAYFFGEDVFHKSRVDIVAALTRIEAEQLPANTHAPGYESRKILGLIYGETKEETTEEGAIPYEKERSRAVEWFSAQGQYDAALLSLKRMMTKFPALYLRQACVEQLLALYYRLELYGFLLEESNRLLSIKSSEAFNRTVKNWKELAKKQVINIKN